MMSRTAFRLFVATVVVSGAYLALSAQDVGSPPTDKGKKAKLFDNPLFGGKESKGAGGGIFDALRDKKMQEEIGLIPEQVSALQKLAEQVSGELEPFLHELQSLPKEEQAARIELFRREMPGYLRGIERNINDILLPEQQERLRQMALQLRMKKMGIAEAFTSPDVCQELRISENQAERIRESIQKIEAQYREKMLDLEAQMQREILSQFSPDQRERIKRMIGPLMQQQPPGFAKGVKGPP